MTEQDKNIPEMGRALAKIAPVQMAYLSGVTGPAAAQESAVAEEEVLVFLRGLPIEPFKPTGANEGLDLMSIRVGEIREVAMQHIGLMFAGHYRGDLAEVGWKWQNVSSLGSVVGHNHPVRITAMGIAV